MKEVNGKREIEAIYDTWRGGIVGYLVWKIKRSLEDGIQIDELNVVDDDGNPDWIDMDEI